MDRYTEITERLMGMLKKGFGGRPNPKFVEHVRTLTGEAMRLAEHGYINQKGRNLINWVEIACSARRHEQWGLERVEEFAFQEAYKLHSHTRSERP